MNCHECNLCYDCSNCYQCEKREHIQTQIHKQHDRSLTERLDDARKILANNHEMNKTTLEKQKETEKGVER